MVDYAIDFLSLIVIADDYDDCTIVTCNEWIKRLLCIIDNPVHKSHNFVKGLASLYMNNSGKDSSNHTRRCVEQMKSKMALPIFCRYPSENHNEQKE